MAGQHPRLGGDRRVGLIAKLVFQARTAPDIILHRRFEQQRICFHKNASKKVIKNTIFYFSVYGAILQPPFPENAAKFFTPRGTY